MKLKALLISAAVVTALSGTAQAADIDVKILNLTNGTYFTPLVFAAHDSSADVFEVGTEASAELAAIAEGGDISGLVTALDGIAAVAENPAGGLLGPAQDATASLNTGDYEYLSIAAMILPTNDAFVGLDAWKIPSTPGTYTVNLNAYDSGTEANDEIRGGGAPGVAGFPAPAGSPVDTGSGSAGTGIAATAEGFVHIHRGVIGDQDATGGVSDIDSSQHRWLNPVARVTVTVK